MQRRGFVKASLATCGAGLLNVHGSAFAPPTSGTSSPEKPAAQDWGDNLSIRGYLNRVAARITSKSLSSYTDAAAWKRALPERRRQYMEMMGVDNLPPVNQRPPLNVTVTGVIERPKYRVEKLYYESLPNLFVPANLYIPNGLTSPAPTVLYVCGHAAQQKSHYQGHPRRFAELGFVCLLIETLEGEECRGYHHGLYNEGWFHWFSRGYTPAGVEMLNGIRGIDLLVQRKEVDPKRIGVTGVSGGGCYSWWVAAGDERVKIAAPVCGTSTVNSYIYDRTIDSNCDCMWWINHYQWDLADLGALIAPRPLLIVDSDRDVHFTVAGTRQVGQQIKQLYTMLGAPQNVGWFTAPGAHSYHPESRKVVFSWFVKHLQGKDIPPDKMDDVNERPEDQESDETLKVYVNGPPAGNRVKTIQDSFIKLAEPPTIANRDDLEKARRAVIAGLRRKSFTAFPATPPPVNLHIEHEFEVPNIKGTFFHFASEEGWRLRGNVHVPQSVTQPAPAVLGLRSPGDEFSRNDWDGGATEVFLRPLKAPWVRASIELRGTGESAWNPTLEWHIRRSSPWIGMTLPGMWVYDTLRALACVRQFHQVDARQIALAARGQMAVVALYAALLDGHVNTLFLEAPPATQDAPSQRDGEGDAVEILSCLQFTDLPQVAGLLHPAELVFIGERPSTYDWAQDLYQRLGTAERFRHVDKLVDWQPL